MRSQRFAECRILCTSETIESKNHTENKELEKKGSVVILCKNENKMVER